MDAAVLRQPLLSSRESQLGYRNVDHDYAMLPMDAQESSRRFVIARGGADFMRDIVGYEPPTDTPNEAVAKELSTRIRYYLANFFLPCRGLKYFINRSFTMQSKAAGYFGVACATSCTAAVIEGILKLLDSVETTCLVQSGSRSDCCQCVDMSPFERMSLPGTFVTPMFWERNEQLHAAGAISTGLICLAMFYLAVRGENPYIAFVAILSLSILVSVRIIDLTADAGSPAFHIARMVLTGFVVGGLLVAAALLRATTRSFGLIGARRGGLGVGARVHAFYLINRATSYADQFATYGFYVTTFWVLAEQSSVYPDSNHGKFTLMCLLLWVNDVFASALLAFVVKCELKRGAVIAMTSLAVTFVGWCLVIAEYQRCYGHGIDTQNALADALQTAVNTAQVAYWRQPHSNSTSWTIVAEHSPLTTVPVTVSLVPSAASLHSLLADTRECLASSTVFSKQTTFILGIMWAMLTACRFSVIVTTALSVRWFFGSRKIAKLFFVFDDNIDDEEKLTVGDVM